MNVLDRIENGKTTVSVGINNNNQTPEQIADSKELLRLARRGARYRWVPVAERLPELRNKGYYMEPKPVLCRSGEEVYKGYYVGYRQINCEDLGYEGDADCDEETGEEYWPEGWYECSSENEDIDWAIDAKITHWMPLPELECDD